MARSVHVPLAGGLLPPQAKAPSKLKTTPTPNRNGSYGIKGGVRMPHILEVCMPYMFCRNFNQAPSKPLVPKVPSTVTEAKQEPSLHQSRGIAAHRLSLGVPVHLLSFSSAANTPENNPPKMLGVFSGRASVFDAWRHAYGRAHRKQQTVRLKVFGRGGFNICVGWAMKKENLYLSRDSWGTSS